jgi:hypothetical protein
LQRERLVLFPTINRPGILLTCRAGNKTTVGTFIRWREHDTYKQLLPLLCDHHKRIPLATDVDTQTYGF